MSISFIIILIVTFIVMSLLLILIFNLIRSPVRLSVQCSLASVGFKASGPAHGNATALRALALPCAGSRP